MKKYNGKSIRNVKTNTGKIPDSVGCCSKTGGGFIRTLTAKERKAQEKLSS
jgi:hypothetical protein